MKFQNRIRVLRDLALRTPPPTSDSLLERFSLLRRVADWILPEYRFKWPQLDWWNDPLFNKYLQSFGEECGNNTDRRYAVSQLLRLVSTVPGDTAEIGAFEGAMSWIILDRSKRFRTHHIFDSFEGLSLPSTKDGTHWTAGALSCAESIVERNLSLFKGRFITYKGWVPSRFPEVEKLTFAFVHIDVDLYQPTKDTLEFFYPRLNAGGIIVCDDYGFVSCPGATSACNEFLSDKPEKMIGLADGGGFMIKGIKCD